jgi:Cof subfamily protein (haloacid dehalogenase superfamily)
MVCLDIDGTLLNSNHQISKSVKDAINKVVNKKNIPVILVSARMPKGIILDKDKTVLDKKFINASDLEQVYKLTKNYDIHISLYKDDEWYIEEMDYWAKQESDITNIIPKISDFKELIELWKEEKKGPNKILCMANPEEIIKLKKDVKADDLNVYLSKPTYLEIMQSKASKTSAIQHLQMKFNVSKEEIIALGDNYNDIGMLEYVGFGVAMGNAPEGVKQCADFVTLTNDEDGVAETLKTYIL